VCGTPGGPALVTEILAQEKHFELLPGAVLLLGGLPAGADQIAEASS
jgi:hypothetical protein